jgi:hypothetical protein
MKMEWKELFELLNPEQRKAGLAVATEKAPETDEEFYRIAYTEGSRCEPRRF